MYDLANIIFIAFSISTCWLQVVDVVQHQMGPTVIPTSSHMQHPEVTTGVVSGVALAWVDFLATCLAAALTPTINLITAPMVEAGALDGAQAGAMEVGLEDLDGQQEVVADLVVVQLDHRSLVPQAPVQHQVCV